MDDKRIRSAIMRRYIGRFLLQTVAWMGVLVVGIFAGIILTSLRAWQSWDPLYRVLKFIQEYILLIILVLWLGGMMVILVLQWRRVAKSILQLAGTLQQMSQDDSAEIELPEDLRELQGMLQKVQAENLRNRRLAADAEQRKNDLVVYLAHDLKTPLTSVLGYLTLLRDEAEISPELRQKYLDIATDKAMRLEDLINEFFEITRFSLKGLSLEPVQLDLSRMLEQLVSEFGPLFSPKNLTCHLQLPPGIVMVADAGKLERVFDNLLRNAVSYSYPGSQICLAAAAAGGNVTVSIANSGDTIPAHKLAHIFEQFYRVDRARTTDEGGAGLGLAIAKEIVELHEGVLAVQSADNRIEFTVTLPLAQRVQASRFQTTSFTLDAIPLPLPESGEG